MIDVSLTPLARPAPRRIDAHKHDFGRVLVVAGSRGMAGAAAIAGMAALRSGAGLVTIATVESVQQTVAGFCPAVMTVGLPEEGGRMAAESLPRIEELAASASVVAIGPGLGRSAALDTMVESLVERLTLPMVIDADALNALATAPSVLGRSAGPRVLTPHAGELERLLGRAPEGTAEQRLQAAAELPLRFPQAHLVVLLKGHGTVVSDRASIAVNPTGNPAMATAGCGDVLTGVIAGLLAQRLGAFESARLGAWLHGAAGDHAAARWVEAPVIATDVLDCLPAAFGLLSTLPVGAVCGSES